MIEHLATLIDTFPGATNQTRCFAHILNLVDKNVLHQFEAPQEKGNKVMDKAARELAAVVDELDDEHNSDVEGGGNEGGSNEAGGVGNDSEDDDTVDDDEDGLPDERVKISEEELTTLEGSVKLIQLVLTKVSKFELLFKYNYFSLFEQLRGVSLAEKNSSTIVLHHCPSSMV